MDLNLPCENSGATWESPWFYMPERRRLRARCALVYAATLVGMSPSMLYDDIVIVFWFAFLAQGISAALALRYCGSRLSFTTAVSMMSLTLVASEDVSLLHGLPGSARGGSMILYSFGGVVRLAVHRFLGLESFANRFLVLDYGLLAMCWSFILYKHSLSLVDAARMEFTIELVLKHFKSALMLLATLALLVVERWHDVYLDNSSQDESLCGIVPYGNQVYAAGDDTCMDELNRELEDVVDARTMQLRLNAVLRTGDACAGAAQTPQRSGGSFIRAPTDTFDRAVGKKTDVLEVETCFCEVTVEESGPLPASTRLTGAGSSRSSRGSVFTPSSLGGDALTP